MLTNDKPRPAAQIVLVDKPGGMTSHDVVSRARRAIGTRKIGHAGTLDPMATGLLVLGVEGGTRLLTYLVGLDKTYEATIRLGQATTTDDAEGEVTTSADASGVPANAIADGIAALSGTILQVPSSVSAIKVDGKRAYDLVRAGEQVELKSRQVTVSRFDVLAERRDGAFIDLDVVVDCSSGTYIRALARDLGDALGVGGHLTALRRTHVGPFDVSGASDADTIGSVSLTPATAAGLVMATVVTTADEARDLRQGKKIAGGDRSATYPAAAVDPEGELIGIVDKRADTIKSIMNMPEVQA